VIAAVVGPSTITPCARQLLMVVTTAAETELASTMKALAR
jgi:hypothetical protein